MNQTKTAGELDMSTNTMVREALDVDPVTLSTLLHHPTSRDQASNITRNPKEDSIYLGSVGDQKESNSPISPDSSYSPFDDSFFSYFTEFPEASQTVSHYDELESSDLNQEPATLIHNDSYQDLSHLSKVCSPKELPHQYSARINAGYKDMPAYDPRTLIQIDSVTQSDSVPLESIVKETREDSDLNPSPEPTEAPQKPKRRTGRDYDDLRKATLRMTPSGPILSTELPRLPAMPRQAKKVSIGSGNSKEEIKPVVAHWYDGNQPSAMRKKMMSAVIEFNHPAMLTLRYRESFLCMSRAVFSAHIKKLTAMYYSAWGLELETFYVIESDTRKVAHSHMWFDKPQGVSNHPTGKGSRFGHLNGLDFDSWIATVWAHITGHEYVEGATGETKVDTGKLEYLTDVKEDDGTGSLEKIIGYFLKQGEELRRTKGYSKNKPEYWGDDGMPVKLWGQLGLTKTHPKVDIDIPVFNKLKRIFDKALSEKEVVNYETGEVTTSKSKAFTNKGFKGGHLITPMSDKFQADINHFIFEDAAPTESSLRIERARVLSEATEARRLFLKTSQEPTTAPAEAPISLDVELAEETITVTENEDMKKPVIKPSKKTIKAANTVRHLAKQISDEIVKFKNPAPTKTKDVHTVISSPALLPAKPTHSNPIIDTMINKMYIPGFTIAQMGLYKFKTDGTIYEDRCKERAIQRIEEFQFDVLGLQG